MEQIELPRASGREPETWRDNAERNTSRLKIRQDLLSRLASAAQTPTLAA